MALLTPLFVGVNIFSILLAIIIIFVNAVAIFLIFRKDRDWENTCYFIANLAVSDGLTGALIVANVIFNLNQHKIFYECIFRLSAVNSAIFASVFILLGVTCDRYMKIVCPLRYTTFMNEVHVKVYLCIIWTISSFLIVTPFLLWIDDVIIMDMCSYFVILKEQYLIGYCLTVFCAMLIQLFMYIHIFVIAVSQGWRSAVMTHGQTRVQVPQRAIINHLVKPSRAIFTMVGINFLTSIPVGVYVYLATTNHFHDLSLNKQGEYLMYVAAPLYLNSLINPFLYAFKIPDIRRTLSRFIPWFRSSNRVEPPTTSYSLDRLGIIKKVEPPKSNEMGPPTASKCLDPARSSSSTEPSTPVNTAESPTSSNSLELPSTSNSSEPSLAIRSNIESSNSPETYTTRKSVKTPKTSYNMGPLRASGSLDPPTTTEPPLPSSCVEPSRKSYRVEPPTISNNTQPSSTSNRVEPIWAIYNVAPLKSIYFVEPPAASYYVEPSRTIYSLEPRETSNSAKPHSPCTFGDPPSRSEEPSMTSKSVDSRSTSNSEDIPLTSKTVYLHRTSNSAETPTTSKRVDPPKISN